MKYGGQTAGIEQAHANYWMKKYLYYYDPSIGSYVTAIAPDGTLFPGKGYWVKAMVEADLLIPWQ